MESMESQAEAQPQAQTHGAKPSLTLTFPSWILAIAKVIDYGTNAVGDTAEKIEEKVFRRPSLPKFSFNREKLPKLNLKFLGSFYGFSNKHKKLSVFVIVILLVGGFAAFKYSSNDINLGAKGEALGLTSSTDSIVAVNRRFEIPIKNKDGSETGERLGITITTIEKTQNILIKNSPAKTKNGKTFLVLNIEIQNDTKKQLTVRPVDMVRLIGDDGRSYAPDVHNNDVGVEAVSLRKTRVGYVVDESKKNFKLLIGEVRGQQEAIEIGF